MTARAFNTIRPGFRVSGGATLGFKTRCGNHTARRFRKLFKYTPIAHGAPLAPQLGSVGASDGQVTAHASNAMREEFQGAGNQIQDPGKIIQGASRG